MEKKIVVPEGMLKAAAVKADVKGLLAQDRLELILEAALLWLISQNPDVGESPEVGIWLRRMFLAPEPEIRTFVKKLADGYRGVTLTPQEADFIVEQLRRVTHGWDGGAK